MSTKDEITAAIGALEEARKCVLKAVGCCAAATDKVYDYHTKTRMMNRLVKSLNLLIETRDALLNVELRTTREEST